jgi:hypothetical protein
MPTFTPTAIRRVLADAPAPVKRSQLVQHFGLDGEPEFIERLQAILDDLQVAGEVRREPAPDAEFRYALTDAGRARLS